MENSNNNKMKVLQVLDTYFPSWDGPTLLVNNYAKCMTKRGDTHVEIVVPKYPKYEDIDPFTVHRIISMPVAESYRTVLPFLQNKTRKIIDSEEHFDIIHCHSPFMLSQHMLKLAKKRNIPSVITLHTRYHEDFDRVLPKFLRKPALALIMKAFKLADYVVCVSDGTVDTLREYGYKGEVKVIRNGTDLKFPENHQELRDKIIEKEKLEKDVPVFLSVGRIVENKKLDTPLSALKILKDQGYKFKYLIVGEGTYEDKLKAKVKKMGLDDMVRFTEKIMDRSELTGYYLASDVFLFPSTFDTASLAPIEAAANKLPSLMNRHCSTAEIITDDRNGYLAEESPEAWAERIKQIIEDREKLKEVKELAYKEVYRSWDSVVDEVRDYYSYIIQEWKEKALKKETKTKKPKVKKVKKAKSNI